MATLINHLPDACYQFIGHSTTMDRKSLKDTLLCSNGWVMANGTKCDVKSKHLAAGVYKVWLEIAK